MARLSKKTSERPDISIAPMIDVVFLMLIYFMVTSSLEKQEADLSFKLPGTVEQSEPLELPDEQIIEIRTDGQVVVNEYHYDKPTDVSLVELTAMLSRYKKSSDANQVRSTITIAPADNVSQQIIIRVMDACAKAGIDSISFAVSEDELI